MPLALVSDIHGNDVALAAVVAELERLGIEQIRAFAPTLDVEVDGLTLRAFHGSPRSYDDVLLPETPDGVAERLLGGSGVDLLAGGHTHLQWTRCVDGALYVNPGSVGLAYDRVDSEPAPTEMAEYALVTGGSVEFRRVPWQSES